MAKRVAVWRPLANVFVLGCALVFWAFVIYGFSTSGSPGWLVLAIVPVVFTIAALLEPLSISLYESGDIRFRRPLGSEVIDVEGLRSIRRETFRDVLGGAAGVWPDYVIDHECGRYYVPRGPVGGRHFRALVVALNPEIEEDNAA